jgi:hypothetical protein
MTFAEVFDWCKKHKADVRAIGRAMEIPISHKDEQLPANLPSMSKVMHWDLAIGDWSHYTSGSDMELMVAGKMTVEEFKSTLRGGG